MHGYGALYDHDGAVIWEVFLFPSVFSPFYFPLLLFNVFLFLYFFFLVACLLFSPTTSLWLRRDTTQTGAHPEELCAVATMMSWERAGNRERAKINKLKKRTLSHDITVATAHRPQVCYHMRDFSPGFFVGVRMGHGTNMDEPCHAYK